MSNWLVCFSVGLPQETWSAIIEEAGAHVNGQGEPVPAGDEMSVQVDADQSAVAALRERSEVLGIYPDSELSLY